MTKKKFVMRKKPAKPVREVEKYYIGLNIGDTIQNIVEKVHKLGVALSEVTLQRDSYRNYDAQYEWVYNLPEDIALYNARLESWGVKMKAYHRWQRDHKEEVAARVAEDKANKKAELKAKLAKETKRAAKAQSRLQQQLDKMEEEDV